MGRFSASVAFLAFLASVPSGMRTAHASQPEAAPVVSTERPMRFVLASGTVVVGTRIGEDAVYYTVQTSAGPVRIRKVDVQYMDFNVGAGAAPIVAPQPTTGPQPAPAAYPRARRRGGSGLIIAGAVTFGVGYLFTLMAGTIASIFEPEAVWLMLPAVGPIIFYFEEGKPKRIFGLLLLSTITQTAGLLLLVGGLVWSGASDDEEAANPLQIADGIDLVPTATPDLQGLALSASF